MIFIYIYIKICGQPPVYIFIIYINNSRRNDKGNQWHDGGCTSDTTWQLMLYIAYDTPTLI